MMRSYFFWMVFLFSIIQCSTNISSDSRSNHISDVKNYHHKTITFSSKDGIKVSADFYNKHSHRAPLILLYHDYGFSRGAFRTIAPRLVSMGFNVLAVDLRNGDMVNQVINLTNQEALKEGKSTNITSTIADLEASLEYVKHHIKPKKIIFWGSSYSASLGFYMTTKHPKDYHALVAYSPGEYFTLENKSIIDYAKEIKIPVFISSAKNEASKWQNIYQAITSEKAYYLPSKTNGYHGSMALSSFYNDAEENWQSITPFLEKLK